MTAIDFDPYPRAATVQRDWAVPRQHAHDVADGRQALGRALQVSGAAVPNFACQSITIACLRVAWIGCARSVRSTKPTKVRLHHQRGGHSAKCALSVSLCLAGSWHSRSAQFTFRAGGDHMEGTVKHAQVQGRCDNEMMVTPVAYAIRVSVWKRSGCSTRTPRDLAAPQEIARSTITPWPVRQSARERA